MVEKRYRLRPHHVKLLGCFISAGEERESYVRRTINSMELEEGYLMDHITTGTPLEYSQDFVDSIIGYYKELLINREADFEVVDGVDDICLLGAGCNRRKASCEGRDSGYSKNFIKEKFGIRVGDICKISHIVDAVENP